MNEEKAAAVLVAYMTSSMEWRHWEERTRYLNGQVAIAAHRNPKPEELEAIAKTIADLAEARQMEAKWLQVQVKAYNDAKAYVVQYMADCGSPYVPGKLEV